MKNLSILLIAMMMSFTASAQLTFVETQDWDEILEMAQEQDKPIFIDGMASWCGWCKWMDKNVFPDETVGQFFNDRFICVKMDMEKDDGAKIAEWYGIGSYPSLLFFDKEGNAQWFSAGARDAESLLVLGESALSISEKNSLQYLQNLDAAGSLTPEQHLEYIMALVEYSSKRTRTILDDYMDKVPQEEMIDNAHWEMFTAAESFLKSAEYQFLNSNKEAFKEIVGSAEVESFLLAAQFKDAAKEENWTNYYKCAKLLIEEYEYFSPSYLNAICWTIYENITDLTILEDILPWIVISVEDDANYYNTDTYAHLLYAVGDLETALVWANKAIQLAEEGEMDADMTIELRDKIEEELED